MNPVEPFSLSLEQRRECLLLCGSKLLKMLGALFFFKVLLLAIILSFHWGGASEPLAPQVGMGQLHADSPQQNLSANQRPEPTRVAGLTSLMVYFIGVLGGYVGLQRRLNTLSDFDLHLMSHSWVYCLLSPFVGGLLALLLQYVFIGKMLSGALFPEFTPTPGEWANGRIGSDSFINIFYMGATPDSYARLVFWSFVAGFSERFVVNMIGGFEMKANQNAEPTDQPKM